MDCGARLLALTIFPELLYALFLDIVYAKGVADLSVGREARWQHVANPPAGRMTVSER